MLNYVFQNSFIIDCSGQATANSGWKILWYLCEVFIIQSADGIISPSRAHIPPTLLFLRERDNAPVLLHYGTVLKHYLFSLAAFSLLSFKESISAAGLGLGPKKKVPWLLIRLLLSKHSFDMKGQPFPIPEALSWCLDFASLRTWGLAESLVLFCGESRPTTM